MTLERTILEFLAASLVAIDGSRAGPIHPTLAQADLAATVVGPVLTSPDAATFRDAIEDTAVRAREWLADGVTDAAALTLLLEALTGHLLAADGHAEPFTAVEEALITLGFDAFLTHELLTASMSSLAILPFARPVQEPLRSTPEVPEFFDEAPASLEPAFASATSMDADPLAEVALPELPSPGAALDPAVEQALMIATQTEQRLEPVFEPWEQEPQPEVPPEPEYAEQDHYALAADAASDDALTDADFDLPFAPPEPPPVAEPPPSNPRPALAGLQALAKGAPLRPIMPAAAPVGMAAVVPANRLGERREPVLPSAAPAVADKAPPELPWFEPRVAAKSGAAKPLAAQPRAAAPIEAPRPPQPEPVRAPPPVPVPPMIAAIADAHGVAAAALMPVLRHPALAMVSLDRLEQALNQSAESFATVAARLGASSGAGSMQQSAQLAVLAGDGSGADQLLSGLEAQALGERRSPAEIRELRAILAEARLDFAEAARSYGAAAESLGASDVDMRWLYALRQGTALQTAFEYYDDLAALEDAVVVYARALEEAAPEGVPKQSGQATLWALTQNSLGNVLTTLGERTTDPERLRLAAWSYGEALAAKDRTQAPAEWAMLNLNRATALMQMAEFSATGDMAADAGPQADALRQAIGALDRALDVYQPRAWPQEHFSALVTRGTAMTRLGFAVRDAGRLQAAAEALMQAAAATPAEASAADRIRIASQLGDVCCELAELTRDGAWLDRAIESYEAALELVAAGETGPVHSATWGDCATSLANALWTSGRASGNTERLQRADTLFSAAIRTFEASGAGEAAAAVTQALGDVRALLYQLRPAPPSAPPGLPPLRTRAAERLY